MKELLRLWFYLKKYCLMIYLGVFCIFLSQMALLAVGPLIGLAVNNIDSPSPDLYYVGKLAGAMAGIILLQALFAMIWRRKLVAVFHHMSFDLRNDLYGHLLKLSFSWFNRMKTGDIMSRATNDIQTTRQVVEFGITRVLSNIIRVVGAAGLMFALSVKLTLLTFSTLLVVTVTIRILGPKIYKLSMAVQEQLATLSSHAQENFSGIRVVKAFAVEDAQKNAFANHSKGYIDRSMDMAKMQAFMHPLFRIIMELALVVTLLVGGYAVMSGDFEYGDFWSFIYYLQQMLWPMASFGFVITRLQRGSAAMARINRILDEEPEIRDDARTGDKLDLGGSIEFKDLTFRYPDSDFKLENINLNIPAGATVGIVGSIGSGKSSFVSLIMRLFDIPDGTVFIGGRDINTIPLRALRSQVGYVPQDSFLFSETVRENISFGNPDMDFSKILEAARLAHIAQDIENFPDKYDQLIGERGVTLSGGQKQRVAIARAIALDPAVLVLDDALSSVDTHTEEDILQGLGDFSKERTTLIISHRISTVSSSDFIIVFDDGRIVEKGSHDELVSLGGIYSSTYHKQRLEEEIESQGD